MSCCYNQQHNFYRGSTTTNLPQPSDAERCDCGLFTRAELREIARPGCGHEEEIERLKRFERIVQDLSSLLGTKMDLRGDGTMTLAEAVLEKFTRLRDNFEESQQNHLITFALLDAARATIDRLQREISAHVSDAAEHEARKEPSSWPE